MTATITSRVAIEVAGTTMTVSVDGESGVLHRDLGRPEDAAAFLALDDAGKRAELAADARDYLDGLDADDLAEPSTAARADAYRRILAALDAT